MSTSYDLYGATLQDLFEIIPEAEIGATGRFMREHVLTADYTKPTSYPANSGSLGLTTSKGRKIFREPKRPDRSIEWKMPAQGKTGRYCGKKTIDAKACTEGHYARKIMCHCQSMSCPVCSPWIVGRKAREVASALISAKKCDSKNHGYKHIVVSPPPEISKTLLGTERGYKSMREALSVLLNDIGSKYAVAIFHPWHEVSTGVWELQPHFHVFALGFINVKGWKGDLYRKHGWVIKVKTKEELYGDSGKGKRKASNPNWQEDDLIRGVAYALSHAGVGTLEGASRSSPSHFYVSPPSRKDEEFKRVATISVPVPEPCPVCGEDHRLKFLHSLRALRGDDLYGMCTCRCAEASTEIVHKVRHAVYVRKSAYDKLLRMVAKRYTYPDDLFPIFQELFHLGVLGSTLDLDKELPTGANIQVFTDSGRRADVSSKLFNVIVSRPWPIFDRRVERGWTPEDYEAMEHISTVYDFTSARLGV